MRTAHTPMVFLLTCAILLCAPALQAAQTLRSEPSTDFPRRSVRLIIPSAPGGGTDLIARVAAQRLSEAWGHIVVVENNSGGATTIGTNAVARSAPDGHTMLLTTVNFAFIPAIYPKLPYDPKNDFAPVIMVATQSSMVTVHPSVPARSIAELIALAKKRPGEISYASGGNGTVGHLSTELFRSLANIKLLHVPYKGTGPGITAIISGEVHMLVANIAALLPHAKSGRLRGLAVTSTTRSRILPELPTVQEAGLPGYEYSGWYGLWVPAKTPDAVIRRINEDFNRAFKDPALRERFLEVGIEPGGGSEGKFAVYLASEFDKWRKVAREANIRMD
ncbi:MAG TPA: tripartite tricarboxylate transporter substrate binding protein [Burkholderiales bacterium]|nr:tripartite tricarboxylate transporter substrate binding protein [Burkholderiales bacterium]